MKRTIFDWGPLVVVLMVVPLIFALWWVAQTGVRVEEELAVALSGAEPALVDAVLPEEVAIEIDAAGQVSVVGEVIDQPGAGELIALKREMVRIKQEADSRQARLLVTLIASEDVKYERIQQVMEALAAAKVTNFTFAVGGDEL